MACTEALLLANGFPVELMLDLIRARLASAAAERVVMGLKTIEVARVRNAEAGRRVLAGMKA